ncbi:MAG: transglutaminaseTgpA domain-containing protein [Actinomycetota bacterium]
MARARLAIIVVVGLTLGVLACAVFDRWLWALPLAGALPATAALAWPRRTIILALLGVLAAVIIGVASRGGNVDDVVDAVTAGPQRLLTTEWPSPATPELVGVVALFIAAATAISAALAVRPRLHLMPLVPTVIVYVSIVGLSAPAGAQLGGLLVIGILAVALAALRPGSSLGDRAGLLIGERRLLPLVAFALAIAALVSVPVAMSVRADPRRADPPARTAPLLDPIEATLALRNLDPPIDVHRIVSDGPTPIRWRTAALADYDGERWTPSLTVRPIGQTLGEADATAQRYNIAFLDDDLSLVPMPGPPVSVDAEVETDAARTVVRLVNRPTEALEIEANLAPPAAGGVPLATREIDDSVSGLTELAEQLGGEGTTLEQLDRIAATMRDEFVLDSGVQGGGLQRALIDRFLRDTRRGTAEQFAAAYALLARALGADARVATGFVIEAGSTDVVVSSADAQVWPELALADGRWVVANPIPAEEAPDADPTPPEPRTQTPAAPQPPIAPPPEPTDQNDTTGAADSTNDGGALSTAFDLALRATGVIATALMPIVIGAAAILFIKARRRARRLRSRAAADRVRGAWASATDALVDGGLSIEGAATDLEIAGAGTSVAGASVRWELRRLATLSSAATFGDPSRLDRSAADAAMYLGAVEAAIGEERSRWQRLRWRLSVRSLRSSTRSPVTV